MRGRASSTRCENPCTGSGALCSLLIGTERGCVEDQPQRVGSSKASGACRVLRLVEDDTAALRSNGRLKGHANSKVSGSLSYCSTVRFTEIPPNQKSRPSLAGFFVSRRF